MGRYLLELVVQGENKDKYPYNLPLFKNGLTLKFNKPITFITGDNGSGKSTLLESLAGKIGFNVLGGNANHSYKDEKIIDDLAISEKMRLVWRTKTSDGFFFRAESFSSFIGYIDDIAKENGRYSFVPYGGKSLQHQSHGESFMSLFENRFRRGVFILDEPEAALSPGRQLELLAFLSEMSNCSQCQFIIATHSPILIACPNSDVYEIGDGEIRLIDYKQTQQFQFYKNFVNCPERYLKYLQELDCDNN